MFALKQHQSHSYFAGFVGLFLAIGCMVAAFAGWHRGHQWAAVLICSAFSLLGLALAAFGFYGQSVIHRPRGSNDVGNRIA